jgi:uncharacterized protein YdiU (UPF0061 family)
MDTYNPATVFSSIDTQGRYAYGNQPPIGGWNLARFAESLLALLHEDEDEAVKMAQDAISEYPEIYRSHWLAGMRSKLGLFNEEEQDEALIQDLLEMMEKYRADFTNTFRSLTMGKPEGTALFGTEEFTKWNERWEERRSRQQQSKEDSSELMRRSNPVVIPRNHRVEEALDAAVKNGDYSVMERLLKVLSKPYNYENENEEYCRPAPTGLPYRTYCGT